MGCKREYKLGICFALQCCRGNPRQYKTLDCNVKAITGLGVHRPPVAPLWLESVKRLVPRAYSTRTADDRVRERSNEEQNTH